MALGDAFKKMLGVTTQPASKARSVSQKTVLAASRRKELIAWAVDIYRRKADMGRGVLDQSLREFRAKPPNPGDVDALARLLRIHSAEVAIRRLMNHRDWRYLILAGMRQLMQDVEPPPAPPPQTTRRIAAKH